MISDTLIKFGDGSDQEKNCSSFGRFVTTLLLVLVDPPEQAAEVPDPRSHLSVVSPVDSRRRGTGISSYRPASVSTAKQ